MTKNITIINERLAKRLSRSGVGSRRQCEVLITSGRVLVNGKKITSPAINVGDDVRIKLKDMNNKSIGRNYIDVSGNKLTPAGVAAVSSDGWFYLTNNLGIFGGVPGEGF